MDEEPSILEPVPEEPPIVTEPVHLSRERHESWKNQSRRQPWVHLQRPLQASLRNLLAVYDAFKGKSVQGFSDGA